MEPAEALREWRDFYVLIGTASGALIGLMFVAASIAATAMGARYRPGMEAFITPTVAHFSANRRYGRDTRKSPCDAA